MASVQKISGYRLELTEFEAQVLMNILNHTAGEGPAEAASLEIHHVLFTAGVAGDVNYYEGELTEVKEA